MIVFFSLNLKQISQDTKNYKWPRPKCCDRCHHSKVWSHGFVSMIFEGFANALRMRRYRCPCCGCIIRLRPLDYFKGHQSTSDVIRKTLTARLHNGHWPQDCEPSRSRHWLRALKHNAAAILGEGALVDLIAAYDQLVKLGRVPVTRAIKSLPVAGFQFSTE